MPWVISAKTRKDGHVTHAQLRRYMSLAPLFVGAMLPVPLADNPV
jgi:hypothetical protein